MVASVSVTRIASWKRVDAEVVLGAIYRLEDRAGQPTTAHHLSKGLIFRFAGPRVGLSESQHPLANDLTSHDPTLGTSSQRVV